VSVTPFVLHLAGRPAEAAAAWDQLGCPYQAALARAECGTEVEVVAALSTFQKLGARPAAQLAAAQLRRLGARVPRGPSTATRTNPAGLTPREAEVARLLIERLTNAEIAERLFISAKTVDHHVSSVLGKLEVPTRRAAADAASRLGL
jgi:DNA-binding NarL/FixJ family response regulator